MKYGSETLTKEALLKRITEYDIFNYYISSFGEVGVRFSSEFRNDSTPSSIISNLKTGLRYHDFGCPEHSFDCFQYVMYKYSLNFPQVLQRIDYDFNLGLSPKQEFDSTSMGFFGVPNPKKKIPKIKKKVEIKVKFRRWNKLDQIFWESQGITKDILKFYDVKPIQYYWINGTIFRAERLSYRYYFGNGDYKIYQPYSKDNKWFSNCKKNIIQGYKQLPEEGEVLIITKALKEVMLYYRLGIPAIAPQAESIIPDAEIMADLILRFKNIYSNYDYDYTGIVGANKLKRKYNIPPIMFDKRFSVKDLSEYCKKFTFEETQILINQTEKWLRQGITVQQGIISRENV